MISKYQCRGQFLIHNIFFLLFCSFVRSTLITTVVFLVAQVFNKKNVIISKSFALRCGSKSRRVKSFHRISRHKKTNQQRQSPNISITLGVNQIKNEGEKNSTCQILQSNESVQSNYASFAYFFFFLSWISVRFVEMASS